jgi:hypothetical protein
VWFGGVGCRALMSGQADSTYVIRSGVEALDRLELLARLFWPQPNGFLLDPKPSMPKVSWMWAVGSVTSSTTR